MAPLISVIVPVYKAEKYLKGCIDSILGQTFKDFELILVDDGSPDTSGEICDNYAIHDTRIIVRHIINGGVSNARNTGLSIASGKYVTFADADDRLEKDAFATYIDAARKYNADIVRAGYYHILTENDVTNVISVDRDFVCSSKYEFHRILEKNRYYSFVWNAFIKRDIISNSSFNTDLSWLEDHTFFYDAYHRCSTFVVLSKPLYRYYVRGSESLSTVNNAELVWKAAEAELLGKLALVDDSDIEMKTATWNQYLYMLNLFVAIIYRRQYSYVQRKEFASLKPRSYDFHYGYERIFFSNMPFWLKDTILNILFKIKER